MVRRALTKSWLSIRAEECDVEASVPDATTIRRDPLYSRCLVTKRVPACLEIPQVFYREKK